MKAETSPCAQLVKTTVFEEHICENRTITAADSDKQEKCDGPACGRSFAYGLLLVALVMLVAPLSALGDAPISGESQILLRFDPRADSALRKDALETVEGEVSRGYDLVPGLRLVELPADSDREDALRLLAGMPGVAFASADDVMRIERTPDDPFFGSLWGMEAIKAPAAWDTTTGSADVAVAVIDTGMDLDHPDLADNLWTNPDETPSNGTDDDGNGYVDDVHGWDFVGKDPVPDDDNSHGSHTAGTVGAVGNNGVGVAGVAWDVSLVPLKICSATGRCLASDAIAALDYAVGEGIPISNNSYGYSGSCTTAFGAALQAAGEAGHLFVASAGNDGRNVESSPKYPASCPQANVLSVAWLSDPTTLAPKSNFGSTSVDLAAPGSQTLSTVPGGYGSKSGTSMAGPHVAGTAALLKSIEPSWGWSQMKERLMASVTPACNLQVASRGTLNAEAAVDGELSTVICPAAPLILNGPVAESGSAGATFIFSGAPGATFSCRLDSNPPGNCLSPVSYSGLTEGSHTFSVTQSVGGGPESASASRAWTVDTVAPLAPTVSAAPASPTRLKTASFTLSGEFNATLSCSLDGSPASACSSTYPVTGLGDGPHSLTVFQTDRAGNRSAEALREWTVDTVPPEPPKVDGGPASLTNARSAIVSFSGEIGATASCRLDLDGLPGVWSSCVSPVVFSGLTDGDYRLLIAVRDKAGNDSAPTETLWTVDTVAPAAPRIDSRPDSSFPDPVEITFSGEADNALECRLEGPDTGGVWEPCSSPFRGSQTKDGSYRFLIRQSDPAGNTSATDSLSWVLDRTAPLAPELEGGPNGPVNTRLAEFTIIGETGALAECLLEAGEGAGQWAPCPRVVRWGELADGPKILRARLRDAAGNQSGEAVRQWAVDTQSPEAPTSDGIPTRPTRSGSASVAIGTESGASAFCRFNDGPWRGCVDLLPVQAPADGRQVLRFFQTDAAGNRSPIVSRTWTVDRIRPVITSVDLYETAGGRYIVNIQATEKGTWLRRIEISSSISVPGNPADAGFAWRKSGRVNLGSRPSPKWVRVVDAAGNRSVWVRVSALR